MWRALCVCVSALEMTVESRLPRDTSESFVWLGATKTVNILEEIGKYLAGGYAPTITDSRQAPIAEGPPRPSTSSRRSASTSQVGTTHDQSTRL
jgi:hypothetical protein